eukprot:GEMP01003000.1.p1 GENE.GEMP01003000.1~~GEMP01003000.1.p1  ORF type:complete len:1236 (+),score=331.39 GEMP01003000.1:126-3833(+)
MVHVSRAEVKGVLGRRDHLRLSRKQDQMSYWHRDLHQYIEKNGRLQESIIVFGQKFLNMGLSKNFVLTTLMDYMWTSLIIMWQSVVNLEIPKLQKDTLQNNLQHRCEELTLRLQTQRAAYLAEVITARTAARGARFLNNYENRVQELMPDDPRMFFDLNASMTEPEVAFFSNAIKETISSALIQGADVSKGELKVSAEKIAGLEIQVEGLRCELDNLEYSMGKRKTQMLQQSQKSAELSNGDAKNANVMVEMMMCKEELAHSQSQADGFRENARRLEQALQEGQAELVKLQELTVNHAIDIKEANDRIIATNLELTSLQQTYDDLAARTDASTEAEAIREKLNRERDLEVAELHEHTSRLEQELQIAADSVSDHAKLAAVAEQEFAEKNQVIVHFEMQIEHLLVQQEQANDQFAKKLAEATKGSSSTQEGLQDQISAMDDEIRDGHKREEEKAAAIQQLAQEKEQLESEKQQIEEELKRHREVLQSSMESGSVHEEKIHQMDERIVEQENEIKKRKSELMDFGNETVMVSSIISKLPWKDLAGQVLSKPKEDVQKEIFDYLKTELDTILAVAEPVTGDAKDESKTEQGRVPESTPVQVQAEQDKQADHVDKSAVAAAEARWEQERQKNNKEISGIRKELSTAKVENTRLTVALEELSKRFEEMKVMMAAKGVDVSIVDAALEQSGLADLVRGAVQGVKVFDRLYTDAMNRLHRQEENRQRILLMQQEELHQVLHVLVTPRNTLESAQEVFDDFYRVLQKYPQGRAALHCGGVNVRTRARSGARTEKLSPGRLAGTKKMSPRRTSPSIRVSDTLCVTSRVGEEGDIGLRDFPESLDRSRSPPMTTAADQKRSDSRTSPRKQRKPQQRPMTQPTKMPYDRTLHERCHDHVKSESFDFLDANRSLSPMDGSISRQLGGHALPSARSPRFTGTPCLRAKEKERNASRSPSPPRLTQHSGHGRSLELFLDHHIGPRITAYNRARYELPPKSLSPDGAARPRVDPHASIRHASPRPVKTLERKPSLAGRPATMGGDTPAKLIIAPIGLTKSLARPQTTEQPRGRQRKDKSPMRDITFVAPDAWMQDATLPVDASTLAYPERAVTARVRDRLFDRSRAQTSGELHLGRAPTKARGPPGDYMRHLAPLRIGPQIHSILGATSVPIIPPASTPTIPSLPLPKEFETTGIAETMSAVSGLADQQTHGMSRSWLPPARGGVPKLGPSPVVVQGLMGSSNVSKNALR